MKKLTAIKAAVTNIPKSVISIDKVADYAFTSAYIVKLPDIERMIKSSMAEVPRFQKMFEKGECTQEKVADVTAYLERHQRLLAHMLENNIDVILVEQND